MFRVGFGTIHPSRFSLFAGFGVEAANVKILISRRRAYGSMTRGLGCLGFHESGLPLILKFRI